MGRRNRSAGRDHPGNGPPDSVRPAGMAVSTVHRAALDSARRLGLGESDTVVVGVSGGPDSTTLLDALASVSRRAGSSFQLHGAHLIHDFRGQEKYDDADFVKELCEKLGVDMTLDEVDVAAYQAERGVSSFEQAARDLRYRFLARVAGDVGAGYVAVAHTADDLAETVLLHIARGSGLHGLRGMPEVSAWPYPESGAGLRLWRPLLGLRREDTIGYCRERGIEFRDDSTNYLEDFARNRVRMNLMPALAEQLNPRIVDAMGRLSRTASTQLDYLEEQADRHWKSVAAEPSESGGPLRIERCALTALHPALQTLILRRAWVSLTGDSKRITEGHLQRMAQIVAGKRSGSVVALPGGHTARANGRWLELLRAGADSECPYPDLRGEFRVTLPWGPVAVGVTKRDGWEVTTQAVTLPVDASMDTGDPMSVYLSPAALADGATVRTWQPGDRIQPLGMTGRRKVQDVFGDAQIPRARRGRVPLLTTPHGIAWVVGVRIAAWAAVRGNRQEERRAVRITFELDRKENQ